MQVIDRSKLRAARLLGAVSIAALASVGAHAQDTETTTAPAQAPQNAAEAVAEGDAIIVTGFRASLGAALDIKRDSVSSVDAIVAEDIAKFPDQNLAESLQRIPGISIQRDGGETFEMWCKSTCRSIADFARVVKRIEAIITDLRAEDIVHGDIHPRNVLVDKKENVSLIDFGWAMSRDFIMCPQEREHFHNAMDNHFDQQHFEKSMLVCQATRAWLALLPPRSIASVTPSANATLADATSIHI